VNKDDYIIFILDTSSGVYWGCNLAIEKILKYRLINRNWRRISHWRM